MQGGSPKGADRAASAVNQPERSASREDAAAERQDPDLELVQRTRAGDQAAFRALFDKYHRRVFAQAFVVVKNPEDANDIVQEAFTRVHRYLDGFKGESSFYTWLRRITMNLSMDYHRRRKGVQQVDYDDAVRREEGDVEGAENILPTQSANPGKTLARQELATRMQAALDLLPAYHQQVIVLRELDGLSYEEIAKIMKVPKGTIMSRLFHARRKMQAALSDYVDGELTPQEGVGGGGRVSR